MKVLVLGANGMLGHKLVQVMATEVETVGIVRGNADAWAERLNSAKAPQARFVAAPVLSSGEPEKLLAKERPDAVLNAIGVIKQVMDTGDRARILDVNACFPHRLADACSDAGVRLIHFSTDCVFSGTKESLRGPLGYREIDPPDGRDLYALSKLMGEPAGPRCLVLRTSIIGHQPGGNASLLEWFLAQTAPLRGFSNAYFTGLPTVVLARLVLRLLTDHPDLEGLHHVAAQPIDKHDLLTRIGEAYGHAVKILPSSEPYCDRRLDGRAFSAATGLHAAGWDALIETMRTDYEKQEHLRQ